MPLKQYLETHNLSVSNFSNICRLSVPVIYRVLNECNIAPRSARRILSATNGAVEYKNIMSFQGATSTDED